MKSKIDLNNFFSILSQNWRDRPAQRADPVDFES